jgi:hypothetical protein
MNRKIEDFKKMAINWIQVFYMQPYKLERSVLQRELAKYEALAKNYGLKDWLEAELQYADRYRNVYENKQPLKITKQYLKKIIKEELHNVLSEQPDEEAKKQALHKALSEDPDYDYIADYTVPQEGQSYDEYKSKIAANIGGEDEANDFFAAVEPSIMNSAKSKRMQDIADADAEGYFTGKY